MIKWLSMTETARELGFKDPRTFRDNYMDQYPPDRTNKQLKWWRWRELNPITSNTITRYQIRAY